jgi:hypothetical protein
MKLRSAGRRRCRCQGVVPETSSTVSTLRYPLATRRLRSFSLAVAVAAGMTSNRELATIYEAATREDEGASHLPGGSASKCSDSVRIASRKSASGPCSIRRWESFSAPANSDTEDPQEQTPPVGCPSRGGFGCLVPCLSRCQPSRAIGQRSLLWSLREKSTLVGPTIGTCGAVAAFSEHLDRHRSIRWRSIPLFLGRLIRPRRV